MQTIAGYLHANLDDPPTVTTPRFRMMAIIARAQRAGPSLPWEAWATALPVVAIETRQQRSYFRAKHGATTTRRLGSHAEMVRSGWTYDGAETVRELVVICDDLHDMIELGLYCQLYDIPVTRLVQCDWPSDQDALRLQSFLELAKEAAIAHAEKVEQLDAEDRQEQQKVRGHGQSNGHANGRATAAPSRN